MLQLVIFISGVVLGWAATYLIIRRRLKSNADRLADAATLQARLAAIVESSEDIIVGKTLQGFITSWNKGAENVLGYSASEMIGQHITKMVPPHRLEEMKTILSTIARGERVEHFDTQRIRKDGTLIDVSLTISPIRDNTGKIIGASKIGRDVTQRKRLDQAINESAQHFRQLADSMPQFVWTSGADGQMNYANRQWLEYTGLTEQDTLGDQGWKPFVHSSDLNDFEQKWNHSVASGEMLQTEVRFLKPSTEVYRWHLVRAVPIRNSDNEITKWFGSGTDIHDRIETERILREQKETVDTLNRLAPLMAGELVMDKLVQVVLDEATQLVGAQFGAFFYNVKNEDGESYQLYSIAGVPRENFEKFPMPRNTQIFAPTFNGESAVRSGNIRLDARYGKNPPYNGMPQGHLPVTSYLAVPVVSRSGEVLGGLFFGHEKENIFTDQHEQLTFGIAAQAATAIDNARLYKNATDLSDQLQRRTEELEIAVSELEAFSYSVSHDLRAPLRAVDAFSNIIENDFGEILPAEALRYLRLVRENSQKMNNLITDLLAFSRLRRQQMMRQ
jgi:PAS domain S-box-containing protein